MIQDVIDRYVYRLQWFDTVLSNPEQAGLTRDVSEKIRCARTLMHIGTLCLMGGEGALMKRE
jgi:hypothetical protein